MLSAFGVDHGEVSKAFNPIKALRATGTKMVDRSAASNFQRGHNQAAKSRGVAMSGNTAPNSSSLLPGFKRAGQAYSHGQASGRKAAESYHNPLPNPFR